MYLLIHSVKMFVKRALHEHLCKTCTHFFHSQKFGLLVHPFYFRQQFVDCHPNVSYHFQCLRTDIIYSLMIWTRTTAFEAIKCYVKTTTSEPKGAINLEFRFSISSSVTLPMAIHLSRNKIHNIKKESIIKYIRISDDLELD